MLDLLYISSFSDPDMWLQCLTQGMVIKGTYYYTDQLISLNSISFRSNYHLVSYLFLMAHSPLILMQWQQDLRYHPDRR